MVVFASIVTCFPVPPVPVPEIQPLSQNLPEPCRGQKSLKQIFHRGVWPKSGEYKGRPLWLLNVPRMLPAGNRRGIPATNFDRADAAEPQSPLSRNHF